MSFERGVALALMKSPLEEVRSCCRQCGEHVALGHLPQSSRSGKVGWFPSLAVDVRGSTTSAESGLLVSMHLNTHGSECVHLFRESLSACVSPHVYA